MRNLILIIAILAILSIATGIWLWINIGHVLFTDRGFNWWSAVSFAIPLVMLLFTIYWFNNNFRL